MVEVGNSRINSIKFFLYPFKKYVRLSFIFLNNYDNNNNNNNSIQFYIYLRAELNSQWRITESARIQTASMGQHRTKQTKNNKTKKNGSAKAFQTQTRLTENICRLTYRICIIIIIIIIIIIMKTITR
jgi:hypothetical protein